MQDQKYPMRLLVMSEVSNDVDKQLFAARSLRFIVDELKPIFNREAG